MDDTSPSAGLLEPSLGIEQSRGLPPFSTQTVFLTSFFGGLIGAAIINGMNSRRMSRPSWELYIAGFVGVLGIGSLFALGFLKAQEVPPEWFEYGSGRAARYVNQGIALLISGGFFLLQKRERKAFEMSGAPVPKGLVPGLITVAVAAAVGVVAAVLGFSFA